MTSKENDVANQIKKMANLIFDYGIILGSGLSSFAEQINNPIIIPYSKLRHMPKNSIQGQHPQFTIGKIGDKNVIVAQGRFHLYQNYQPNEAVFIVKLYNALNIKNIILTNASGGLNSKFTTGDIMLINDHINLTGKNPLIDKNEFYFLDMKDCYNKKMIENMSSIAKKLDIELKNGTYMQVLGPNYETKAESEMFAKMGGDCVGMSTVIETIMARKFDMNVMGLSLIANMCLNVSDESINHKDVVGSVDSNAEIIQSLLVEYIKTF